MIKTKKILTLLLLTLLCVVDADAVLREQNLTQTLQVLCSELSSIHLEEVKRMQHFEVMNKQFNYQTLEALKRSRQIEVMLYSQNDDYIFDRTYACNEATS